MLRFCKREPPPCLDGLVQSGEGWESVYQDQKDEMRRHLLAEQGGLCAYCQRRIEGVASSRVEHWKARSRGGPVFGWTNLLAACSGTTAETTPAQGATRPESGLRHCDQSKGNLEIQLQPVIGEVGLDPRAELRYLYDGRVDSREGAPGAVADDLRVLNLNCKPLLRAPKAAIDAWDPTDDPYSGEGDRREYREMLRYLTLQLTPAP